MNRGLHLESNFQTSKLEPFILFDQELFGFFALGIQSPCQMMIGEYNHLLSKVFRSMKPLSEGDWIYRVGEGIFNVQELDFFLVLQTCEVWLQYAHARAEVCNSHWSCRHQKKIHLMRLISKMMFWMFLLFKIVACLSIHVGGKFWVSKFLNFQACLPWGLDFFSGDPKPKIMTRTEVMHLKKMFLRMAIAFGLVCL